MSDIKIEDDYLTSYELKQVQDLFSPAQPDNKIQNEIGTIHWILGEILNYGSGKHGNRVSDMDNYQLSRVLYRSPDAEIGPKPVFSLQNNFLFPIFFAKIDPKCLLRVKANLQMRTTEIRENGFHWDYPVDKFVGAKTSIFYINSNDGYTEFKDGTRIESVANRLVTFPLHMEHRGTTCTDKPFRLVINFNYF